MLEWKIETRKIADLKPYHKNPRSLSKEQAKHLQTSLEKFGLIDKPIINTDNTIIGGHQRLAILKKMKHKEVEVYVPSSLLNDKDLQQLNIRLNQTGEFDFDILANQYELSDLVDWGFDEKDFQMDLSIEEKEESPKINKKTTKCPSCGCEF